MDERRQTGRHRLLKGGKIIFNDRRSVIDCLVRNFSDQGVCLHVNSAANVPREFELAIDGTEKSHRCHVRWATRDRIGAQFADAVAYEADQPSSGPSAEMPEIQSRGDFFRGELLTLRAALDEIHVGIVLLDSETRAQFMNRAFRRMWRLSDEVADSKPPFVALMYHGRDTRAYAVPAEQLDAYVADRVALVKAGDTKPLDLRLANGEVIRVECAVLPSGGRLLSYTFITDIVG
ncbi:MAG: PAS-domain containing protein, partial [Pseudolabrys sp.]|nr:PAS-domain containing protein [Pseudolabrys sp.]